MSYPPISNAESLRIGTVEYVSPDEIKVQLELEAPTGVALNTGAPRAFPRVNSYLLIPNDEGHLVAQVEWVTIERSQFPKRHGMQDFGLVDLPYPQRRMKLNPLGILRFQPSDTDGESEYEFRRGMESFPSVGDPVLLPTDAQLRGIIESGENRHVVIGTSPLAANAEVRVNPDRLFGRHLAVLGNTGSGKSCTVSGLIRWSLEAAQKARDENAEDGIDAKSPNARFIILDPNGEYTENFRDFPNVTVFSAEPGAGSEQLEVPLWFWNSAEWAAFTLASEKAQQPLLRRALREARGASGKPHENTRLFSEIRGITTYLESKVQILENYDGWKLRSKLEAIAVDLLFYSEQYINHKDKLTEAQGMVRQLLSTYSGNSPSYPTTAITPIITILKEISDSITFVSREEQHNEDTPIPFKSQDFLDSFERLVNQENNPQFFEYLLMRVRTLLSDPRINRIVSESEDIELKHWLDKHLGRGHNSGNSITIIDLSLVPAEVVHIVTAVISRVLLEALQRYRKLNNGAVLPTVMVMEEAHTFIKRYQSGSESQSAAEVCSQSFEKIAREGRKFGLGLVLSSQRPSELSPTVLSQCNTYLLHRISNDRDQELVNRLVPDNLRGLLRELPSLPSQNAILLGWGSELPTLLKINHLAREHRPQSDDPAFWKSWTLNGSGHEEIKNPVGWDQLCIDWQQQSKTTPVADGNDDLE